MKIAQHTSAPWGVVDTNNEPRQRKIGTEYGISHALVFGDTEKEAEANARLIAAAPDLLEACKAINALATGQGRLNMLDVAAMARAAITKARGAA